MPLLLVLLVSFVLGLVGLPIAISAVVLLVLISAVLGLLTLRARNGIWEFGHLGATRFDELFGSVVLRISLILFIGATAAYCIARALRALLI